MLGLKQSMHATSITLHERFTLLSGSAILDIAADRSPSPPMPINGGMNRTDHYIEALARRLDREAKIAALRQRLGLPQPLYRRSDQYLGGLRRANSFGNLGRAVVGHNPWDFFDNLSRSASFNNLSQEGQGRWQRNYRRHLATNWRFGGAFRFNRLSQYNIAGYRRSNWFQIPSQRRGNANMGGRRRTPQQQLQQRLRLQRQQQMRQQRLQQQRQQRQQIPEPTREELDQELDEYMAGSRSVLDQQLDEYMRMVDVEDGDVEGQ